MGNPNNEDGYGSDMHLYEPNEDQPQISMGRDIGTRKPEQHAMPLHEILHAMGHHDMAKLVKKHAPKQKMKISSLHVGKGKLR